jgi:hypothetical protein
MKKRCVAEKDETPEMEGRSHPVSFLRKATRVAEKSKKKPGGRAKRRA